MYNNWIGVSGGIDINNLMIHENVRFVIADTCLKTLVLNDPIDMCCPNNENLKALDEKIQKSFWVLYWIGFTLIFKTFSY